MTAEKDQGRYIRPYWLDKRATNTLRAGWALQAFAWDWLYWNPLRALPVETASDTGSWLMKRIGPLTSANRTVIRNLRLAFPDWSEKEIAQTAKASWENLGRLAAELPHVSRIHPRHPDHRVEVVNGHILDELNASGKAAVFIGGHFANLEVLPATIVNWPVNCLMTYRAANNPYIDRRINKARADYGVKGQAPKGAGTRELMRALSSNQSIALMNDQKFNEGMPIPFFGHDAMTAPGPTRLAMKFGVPLIPMNVRRVGKVRYQCTVYEPFMPETGPDENAAIRATLVKINTMIEGWIREAPDQWFWQHNRWPKEAWAKAGVM
jgi:KDO2-lipid IV(A) lauroyltransferase